MKTFDEWYELAKLYYEAHGNLLVPVSYVSPDGSHLGGWISRIRNAYIYTGSLSIEQVHMLEKIGMVWQPRTVPISIAQGGEGNPVLSSDDIAEILELAEIVTSDFSYNAETSAATGKFKNEISQVNISWDDKGKITYVGVGTSEEMCEYRAENSEYTITVY